MANNILLLEDDMSLIDGLQYSLKKNGYAVEVARTVSEAKRLLQNIDQYDLLILDVTLPDGTGFEICEMVRNRNEHIPIISFGAWIPAGMTILRSLSNLENCVPVFGPYCAAPEFLREKKDRRLNVAIFP